MNGTVSTRLAAATLIGPVVWAGHFVLVYASESLFCRLADGKAHTALLALASGLAILAVIVAGRVRSRRPARGESGRWLRQTGSALDALSILAIIWAALTGLALPACA